MNALNIQDPFLFGEWFDICWFHSCYTTGLTSTIHERLGYGLSQLVDELDGDVQRIYFSRGEWTQIGERYLKEVVENPELLRKLLSDLRIANDVLWNFSEETKERDFSLMNKKEQIGLLHSYHQKHHEVWALGQVTNVLELENSFLTDYLKNYLRSIVKNGEELITIFQVLVTPRELSQAQKEEREMLLLSTQATPKEQLKLHHQKYSWLHFGWTGPSLTEAYFEEVHRGLFDEGKAQERFDALQAKDAWLMEEKEKYLREWNIPPEKQELFRLLEELLFVKAHRMDALFLSYEAIQPLLKKISQDNFISLKQIYTLYIDSIIENVEKEEFDAHVINEIAQYSVRYYDGEQFHFFVGQQARDFMSPLQALLPKKIKVDELKGECAYPGKISGRVCIVNRASEMGKFQDQDILVSNVTDPSLLPIMKKASAFVTNMGGLTCHAAIVARELHVPCVVGTKIATHIFQDGDLVEVDATNGIVKRI